MWATRARKITFALFVFSMFFWGYVVARILSGIAQPSDYFIDNLPVVLGIEMTFLNLGIITFVLGFIFFLTYLLLGEREAFENYHCHECEAEAFVIMADEDSLARGRDGQRDGDGKEIV